MRSLLFAGVLIVAACQPEPEPKDPGTTGTGQPTTGTPGGTPGGTPTGTTSTTDSTAPVPVFDCDTVPSSPLSTGLMGNASGYHDVAFTPSGEILGNDSGNQNLIKVDQYNSPSTLVSGIGTIQQMTWMPDGDLAVATDATGAIMRVDLAGNMSVIAPSIGAYGLIWGPDDMLWAANYNAVLKIDPITGAQTTVVGSLPNGQPRVINFNLDHTRLYIGTLFGNGNIFYVDLDANYDVVGSVQVFATGVGSGSYHDGLGVDVCGYLWVPDYSTSALYRISPSGSVQTYIDSTLTNYGHGLEWGNGVGNWLTDAIYMPLPYNNNQVAEIQIGVPMEFDGDVINIPSATP